MSGAQPMNFVFATWEGGGSVAPALTVAEKLVRRGHQVRVISDLCNRAEAEAAGARFVAWTRAPSRPDRTPASDTVRDWEAASPPEVLMRNFDRLWCGRALDYARDLIEELDREPADLVVSSEMLVGVQAACEARGQALALLSANISLLPLPGCPPMGPGLAPARTEADRAMHAEVAQGCEALFDHGLPALNAARAALGLEPLEHLFQQARAADRILLGTSRAFDFAPDVLPDRVRYVGPQLGAIAWAAPWRSPWPDGDARPLVLAGFSTTFQNHTAVLQRVIDAAASLPVRLLVTLGGSVEPGDLVAADNTALVDSAPHDAVLAQAALVVTHGGHGTVSRALVQGRPLLVIPHGRDQNDNAVRVTERGAGLSLAPGAGVEEIRQALAALLEDRSFTQAARRLGAAVAAEAENSPVVEELEALCRVRALEAC